MLVDQSLGLYEVLSLRNGVPTWPVEMITHQILSFCVGDNRAADRANPIIPVFWAAYPGVPSVGFVADSEPLI